MCVDHLRYLIEKVGILAIGSQLRPVGIIITGIMLTQVMLVAEYVFDRPQQKIEVDGLGKYISAPASTPSSWFSTPVRAVRSITGICDVATSPFTSRHRVIPILARHHYIAYYKVGR